MKNNDKNRIVLHSEDNNKSLHLVSKGPRTATIVIPTHTSEFNFIDSEEIENEIARKLVNFSLLPKPVITSPLNQAQDYTGGITIDPSYVLPAINGTYDVTTVIEISKTLTFTDFVYRASKVNTGISSVTQEELRDVGITKYDSEGNINIYYVRARIYYKDYVTEYSDAISFSYSDNSYQQPVLSTCDLEVDGTGRYTGNVEFSITPPVTQYGTPGEPNILEIHIKENSQSDFTVIEKEFKESVFKHKLVPFYLYPGHTYNIKLRYKNTLNSLCSPFTLLKTLVVPVPRLLTENLDIVQNVNNVSSIPTIGVDNLHSDYDYINYSLSELPDLILPKSLKEDHINNLISSELKYDFSILKNGIREYNRVFKKPLSNLQGAYYKGLMFTVDDFSFNLNTEYTLRLNVALYDDAGRMIPEVQELTDDKVFTTSNIKNNIPVDGLTTPITTVNGLSFYGEVTQSKLFPDNITYKGEFIAGNPYTQGDEVSYNNELYVFTDTNRVVTAITDPGFLKIDSNSFNRIYKSGLPSYTWLAKEIGLPMGIEVKIDNDGNIVRESICSPLVNETEGWIKTQNASNQILYIAKKPIVTNIPYKELEKRFLTGHGSRTIRLGDKYYSVRLLEYSPNSAITPSYNPKDKNNVENETELFSELFLRLNSYKLEDLGILEEDAIFYGAEMIIKSKSSGTIVTTFEELKDEQRDISNLTFYRPVLEYVQEGYLPFRKPKNLPGPNMLTYDKWSDTGYYGTLTSSSLLTSNEIKSLLGLNGLNIDSNNILFHKFYYHGLTVYIPSKPIGTGINIQDLSRVDAFYGTNDRNRSYNIISSNYKFTTLNLYKSYFEGEKGMFYELVSRVCPELLDVIKNEYNLTSWTTNTPIDLREWDAVILKDLSIDGNERFTLNSGRVVRIPVETEGSYLPIIVAETLDLSNNLKYPSNTYKDPVITMQSVNVRKTVITKETITKERTELRTRLVTKIKWVTRTKKVPNGTITFNKGPKNKDDNYGVILYYASKTDNAYIKDPLYSKTMLNVAKYKGTLGIQYSDKYKAIDNYILRSVMVMNKNNLVASPLHINKTFSNSTQLKNYIRSLSFGEFSLCSLKNYVPDVPNTNANRNQPLGMVFGNISSSIMYYALPSTYDLFPDTLDTNSKMNISPVINYLDGSYKNSWTSMIDRNDVEVDVPMLNSFLPYESYTTTGKELIDSYIKYIANDLGLDLSGDNFNISIDSVKKNYVFGVIGVDLLNLYYLDGNGIVYGDMYNPILKQFTDQYRLPKYFGTGAGCKSTGNDYTDIMNPVEGYDIVELPPEPVEYQVEEQYLEYIQYQEEEYVEKYIEETVQIPVLTYN